MTNDTTSPESIQAVVLDRAKSIGQAIIHAGIAPNLECVAALAYLSASWGQCEQITRDDFIALAHAAWDQTATET